MGKRFWITLILLLTACQGAETTAPPVETPQTALPSLSATITLPPTPSLIPSPIPPTPSPVMLVTSSSVIGTPTAIVTIDKLASPETKHLERLWFSVATRPGSFHDSAIAFANADGTGLEMPALFEPYREIGEAGQYLAWSPDGRYLAFDGANESSPCAFQGTDCSETNYGISIADMKDSQIVYQLEGTLTNPSWSPDSRYLVVSRQNIEGDRKNPENWSGDLYKFDLETGQSQQLTSGVPSDIYPAWSPDGNWIAFLRYVPLLPRCPQNPSLMKDCNQASLYLMRSDGTDLKLIMDRVHVEAGDIGQDLPYNAPVWSPDSKRLALLVGDKQPDIAMVNIDDNEIKLFVASEAKDYYLSWSPDGNRLVFVSDRVGNNEIYILSAEGTDVVNLTQSPADDFAPAWSPSGRYIAFLSNRGGKLYDFKLFVMSADGKELAEVMGEYKLAIGRPTWLSSGNP